VTKTLRIFHVHLLVVFPLNLTAGKLAIIDVVLSDYLPRQERKKGRKMIALYFLIYLISVLCHVPLTYAQDGKLERAVVSYAGVSGLRGPLWIAKETGLFEKYGLDVRLVQITAGTTSINALIAGNVDMVITTSSAAIAAALRGAPVTIIATGGAPPYKLVAHPSVTSALQLKGKVVGSSQLGSGADFALRKLLPKLGLTPSKDVTILPTGLSEPNKRMLLIFQGRIDATLGTLESILQFELGGQKLNVLADLREMEVYVSGSDIATTREFLKNYPHRAKAFLKAFSEAIWTGMNNKEILYRVYRKYLKVDDARLLESMHKSYFLSGTIPLKPYPQLEAIQSDIEFLSLSNPAFKDHKPADVTDPAPLSEIEGEGFFARLQR
jgi:NitT/TauT family transport system substrate-binding protein